VTDPRKVLEEAGYVAVGLGLIAFQRAQVHRREIERLLTDAGIDLDAAIETGREAVAKLVEALHPTSDAD
jgi:hypothetical protein